MKCHLHLFVPHHLKYHRGVELCIIFNLKYSIVTPFRITSITFKSENCWNQCEWNTIDCHVNMPRKIERLQWRNVSKKYLRKIILARMCSSTGKCCSFRGASTFQNHRDWLMIAKTKIICRQCGFYLVKNQKRLNCADRRDLMLCEREELLFKVGANTILPPKQRNICPRKAPQNGPTYQFLW